MTRFGICNNRGIVMQWSDSFNLGISSIDAQHRELVKLLNKLQLAMQKGDSQAAYANTIRALVEYTRLHFADEEAYMQLIRYPDEFEHKKIHGALVEEIKKILISLKQNKPIQPVSLMRFLNEWVCKHILEQDMKIGAYVKSQRSVTTIAQVEITPFGEDGAAMFAKFQSLSKLFEQQAITPEEFITDCGTTLDAFFAEMDDTKYLEKALSFTAYLVKQNVIADTDKQVLDSSLVKRALAAGIMARFNDASSKLRFLKSLHEAKVLTDDDLGRYRDGVPVK